MDDVAVPRSTVTSAPRNHGDELARLAWALGLIVFGARLFAVWYAGSPLPYYDQWMLEFHNTLLKLEHGDGILATLFWRHNEHLMVTEKLLILAGFTLNGYWDVYFVNVIAAVVRAVEAAWLFRLVASAAPGMTARIVWFAFAVIFAGPTSGFNLLCGMQITFYLVELCFAAALACALSEERHWFMGPGLVVATALGLVSMGSGISIPLATAMVGIARRRRASFWAWWVVSAALAVWRVFSVPQAGGSLRPSVGALQRLAFGLRLFGWPVGSAWFGALLVALLIAAALWARRNRLFAQPAVTPILAFSVFAVTNVCVLAANRAPEEFHQRHWELVAMVSLAVIAYSAWLVAAAKSVSKRAAIVTFVLGTYLAGFALHVWPRTVAYLRDAREHRAAALAYYRHLFTSSELLDNVTGVDRTLDRGGETFYDDPTLRFTPHRGVMTSIARAPLPSLALLSPDILPTRAPSVVSSLTRQVIRFGWVAAVLGIAILCRRTKLNAGIPASK